MILGMSFCKYLPFFYRRNKNPRRLAVRNTYSLFNFGEWANGNSKADPYIQLSSITDTALAKKDFINIRLGGTDTTSSSRWTLLPADQQQHSPIPSGEKKKLQQEKILSRWPYILSGCMLLVLISIGLCIWKCCCRRGKAKSIASTSRVLRTKSLREPNPFSGEPASTTYLPLDEPSIAAGGVWSASGGKYSSSQYSMEPMYDHNTAAAAQYPPGVHYPPAGQYGHEPKSPVRSVHSFDTAQHPPHPGTQYPPSASHYPPSQAPPQYTSHSFYEARG